MSKSVWGEFIQGLKKSAESMRERMGPGVRTYASGKSEYRGANSRRRRRNERTIRDRQIDRMSE